ncbi:MAG: terpene cyclase/mutase family protein [Planctomycetaceae bacterium]|jgi:squalene-hopene/tetraprenyl-beta-curcumene cyclase|nr:terpene cyclase/mutase family protein [Planctomycetaceae bacterium]
MKRVNIFKLLASTFFVTFIVMSIAINLQDLIADEVRTEKQSDSRRGRGGERGGERGGGGRGGFEDLDKNPTPPPAQVAPLSAEERKSKLKIANEKAIAFLRKTQSDKGSWAASPRSGIGPTAIIITGLINSGVKLDDPMIKKGFVFLEAAVSKDGKIYSSPHFQNYETSVATIAFAAANKLIKAEGKEKSPYDELLANAQKALITQQYAESRDVDKDDPRYGGIGYGGDTRPDLSNTQFFLDALKATGKNSDDPAIQKALIFVSRNQNLESEHNKLPFAAKNPDGGFIYTSTTGSSSAGTTANGGLRSYASMTYAGLKSMIHAGLTKEDKRVKAAYEWITKNYSVVENPGMGQRGLFYYYHTMAKALAVVGEKVIVDGNDKKHDWRSELIDQLLSCQKDDGSWINEAAPQWMENDPHLVTGFVLLVLAECASLDK